MILIACNMSNTGNFYFVTKAEKENQLVQSEAINVL